MTEAFDRLSRVLDTVPSRLAAMSDEEAAAPASGTRWSAKEIIGHLIDSASNNHQRFVRAQLSPALEMPTYQQDVWVAAQRYSLERWSDLVTLWTAYNRHLLHVISRVPVEALTHTLAIGGNPPATLEFVMADYVRHLEHHLAQIPRLG